MESFSVFRSPEFDRLAKKLARQHVGIVSEFERVISVLADDPYNASGKHKIKKLTDARAGDGCWRLRTGNYRFRYDIVGKSVYLKSVRHRRDSYR